MTETRVAGDHEQPGSQGTGPLAGLRVLELWTSRAGAFASVLLADLGADVVKVEPFASDKSSTDHPATDEAVIDRLAFDRGKRSVAADDPAGPSLRKLIEWADVLVDEGTAEQLADRGIEDLVGEFPDVVHCSITPFGSVPPTGAPLVTASSVELVVQALSGNMDLTGEAGGPPFELGVPLGALASGVYAAIGVLGAVLGGGRAQLEVAQMDVAVALLSYMAVGYFADGEAPTRVGTGHSTIFPYNAFRASDGEVVVAPFTQRFWQNFCRATGRDDLLQVDTYKDFARRLRHKDALLELFEPILAARPVAEWVEIFRDADVPAGPVLSVAGALALAQTVERGLIAEFALADGAVMASAGSPFRFLDADGTSFAPTAARPPHRGEHSADLATQLEAARRGGDGEGRGASEGLPLRGVRVLDLTRMFAGPCATEALADLGAEVIKVEEPRIGDPTRRNLPFWGSESAYFLSLNRGKRSITLDLKKPGGQRAALDLIATCDVVVENYRPGVMSRLGLDWPTLSEQHPALVLCSLSGFGATGPLRDKISFDLVNQAMSGLIDLTGDPEQRPVRVGVPVGDMLGGLYLALAALAALRARDRTGRGSWVDLSLHDVLISLLTNVAQRFFVTGANPTRTGSRHRDQAPQGCYRASDGWLVLSAVTDPTWQALLTVLEAPELGKDDRFATPGSRRRHLAALDALLAERLQEATVGRWLAELADAGIPAAPVSSLPEVLGSPLVTERGIIFTAEHPTVGTVRNLASPLVIDGHRAGTGGTSPVLGADTTPILAGLGYDDATLAALAAEGVIRAEG